MLGTEIGRYRLARLLGRGGMGRVYLGVQPRIRSRVAIKLLADELVEVPALLERFFAEARAVNLIGHEHIINILDLDALPGGRPYIVMEYIEGKTLRDLLEAGPPPLGVVMPVIVEALLALDAAHAAGIIHRDLKPDNIMVTAAGHAKVLDFGIAKLAGDTGAPRTKTGLAVGTPHYMAPEQIRGEPVDARTDVYAIGVALFEVLTTRRPFDGTTDYQLMNQHLETPPPSARALRPELPPALEAAIERALAKRPADRYPTARAMADALRAAMGEPVAVGEAATLAERPAPRADSAPTQPSRPARMPEVPAAPGATARRWPLVAVGAGALGTGVLAVVALRGRGTVEAPRGGRDGGPTAHVVSALDAASLVAIAPGDAALAPIDAPIAPGDAPAPGRHHVGITSAVPAVHDDGTMVLTLDSKVYIPHHGDLARFDVMGAAAIALRAARAIVPDAVLVSIMGTPIAMDGSADLTEPNGEVRYELRSASAGAGVRSTTEAPCAVFATVVRGDLVASNQLDTSCAASAARPHCTFAAIRRRDGWGPNDFVTLEWERGAWKAVRLRYEHGFSAETHPVLDDCR